MAYNYLNKYLTLFFTATFVLFLSPDVSLAQSAGLTTTDASSSASTDVIAPISTSANSAGVI